MRTCKNKENGMPAFAGMTKFFVGNFLSIRPVVTPAKAGVPFGSCGMIIRKRDARFCGHDGKRMAA